MSDPAPKFVSRAGLKLAHALDAFAFDPTGLRGADFGCNVGGFTDCLLQRGAASVVAVDTGYGTLAWTLRNDPRVTVRERTNALHAEPPAGGVDLVVVDLAWTPQRLAVPAALRWLADRDRGRIITLVKPHYEAKGDERGALDQGRLDPEMARRVFDRVCGEWAELGAAMLASTLSPITGGKSQRGGGGKGSGNTEYLALLAPA